MNWNDQMKALQESARLLNKLNVIDVEFSDGSVLEVYIAMTKEERAIGLSTVPYLDVDGMLFYYENASYVPFTMIDMGFDLDIAWFDAAGNVLKSGTFPAGHTDPIFCPYAFSYVIETQAGTLPVSNLKVKNVQTV